LWRNPSWPASSLHQVSPSLNDSFLERFGRKQIVLKYLGYSFLEFSGQVQIQQHALHVVTVPGVLVRPTRKHLVIKIATDHDMHVCRPTCNFKLNLKIDMHRGSPSGEQRIMHIRSPPVCNVSALHLSDPRTRRHDQR